MSTDYSLTIGPLLIGVIINAFIFGICALQLFHYFIAGYKDNMVIVILLIWVFVVDSFQVGSSVAMLWHYVVANFTNPEVLLTGPWEYATLPILSSLASVPIQHFMAYRIMRFSKQPALFALISLLSLAAAAMGCVSAAQGLRLTSIESHVSIIPTADAWLALSVACDVTITLSMLYYLHKSRTGFKRTDSIITRICRTTVEAAVPVTLLCILDLAFLTSLPNNNLHYMFALPVGRLYTNTVLLTLNDRRSLRAEASQLSASANQQGINLSMVSAHRFQRQSPAQIRIDVERATATDAASRSPIGLPTSGGILTVPALSKHARSSVIDDVDADVYSYAYDDHSVQETGDVKRAASQSVTTTYSDSDLEKGDGEDVKRPSGF